MSPSVKLFLAPYYAPEASGYNGNHFLLALAEGFKELGISCYGDGDYWYPEEDPKPFITKAPADFESTIDIYSSHFFLAEPEAIRWVDFKKKNILIDAEDGLFTSFANPEFSNFSLILRTHYNRHIEYPKQVRPWAFGLTNRMIEIIDSTRNVEMSQQLLINYRLGHTLRKVATEKIREQLGNRFELYDKVTQNLEQHEYAANPYSYWAQTGRRHDPKYFELLNSAAVTSCFGGNFYLISDLYPGTVAAKYHMLLKKFSRVFGLQEEYFQMVYQYDSWRFWEASYSNSVALHVDFDYWKFMLPEQPVNGRDYLGIRRLSDTKEWQQLAAISETELVAISNQGTLFSKKFYSPKPTAERLLNWVD